MLRSKQYVKLYKKYHSLKIDQPYSRFYIWQRSYNQVCIIVAVKEWGKYCEKNLRKLWSNCR